MRGWFPGYYPPTDAELEEFFTGGLIVLDTSALFAAYRFTPQAREEFIAVLAQISDVLWVPHQVGKEYHANRDTVIKECYYAADVLVRTIDTRLGDLTALLETFGQRAGIGHDEVAELDAIITGALDTFHGRARDLIGHADIKPGTPPDQDPICRKFEALLDGKVGPVSADPTALHKEAMRRNALRIPPGYEDAKKKNKNEDGDYILWAQTILEAGRRKVPVLLITNDEKEDWVHLDQDGDAIGPRSELVLEMLQEAGQRFHLMTVPQLLVYARDHLAAHVSDSTVDQATAEYAAEQTVTAAPEPDTGDGGAEPWQLQHPYAELDLTPLERQIAGLTTGIDLRAVRAMLEMQQHSPLARLADDVQRMRTSLGAGAMQELQEAARRQAALARPWTGRQTSSNRPAKDEDANVGPAPDEPAQPPDDEPAGDAAPITGDPGAPAPGTGREAGSADQSEGEQESD